MKLLLLPPLVVLCSDLLLGNPHTVTALNLGPSTHLDRPGLAVSARSSSNIIFHPSDGLCVLRKSLNDPLSLGPCNQTDKWAYTPQKFLVVKGTYFCLQAVDSGKPARLGIICTEPESSWEVTTNPKPRLSTTLAGGSSVCLDVDPGNILVTNPCICLSSGTVCKSDSQWFEIIPQNRDKDSAVTVLPTGSPSHLP